MSEPKYTASNSSFGGNLRVFGKFMLNSVFKILLKLVNAALKPNFNIPF